MSRTILGLLFAVVLVGVLVPASAAAQTSEMEAFRQDLLDYVDEFAALSPSLVQVDPQMAQYLDALAVARIRLTEIEDVTTLVDFRDILLLYPDWWNIPSALKDLFENGPPSPSPSAAGSTAPVAANCANGPPLANTCDGCPANTIGGPLPVFILLGFEIAAELVFDIINSDFWPSVPNPAKIISGIVFYGIKGARVIVEGVNEIHVECETNWGRSIANTNLDVQISTRASQEDLDRMGAQVNEARDGNVRRRIAANMSSDRGNAAIASFLVPKPMLCSDDRTVTCTVDADCMARDVGECDVLQGIDLVASIVREVIDDEILDMENVRRADRLFMEGETFQMSALYREAYERYRAAYRDAVR